jgi:cupin superfamily acireductone dioxygenase involved in methionine salvage
VVQISRAGKQQKAFWRAEEREAARCMKDPLMVVPANTPHHFDCERRRSFAAGWIAGVNWAKRNANK